MRRFIIFLVLVFIISCTNGNDDTIVSDCELANNITQVMQRDYLVLGSVSSCQNYKNALINSVVECGDPDKTMAKKIEELQIICP